jgi:hypothetical protein
MKSEELYAKEDLNTMNSGERKTGVDVSRQLLIEKFRH